MLSEKNNLLEEKLNELKEFERKIKLEKEQREKATSILEFQLTEQQRQNQIEKYVFGFAHHSNAEGERLQNWRRD